jgi:hypothetical protein
MKNHSATKTIESSQLPPLPKDAADKINKALKEIDL